MNQWSARAAEELQKMSTSVSVLFTNKTSQSPDDAEVNLFRRGVTGHLMIIFVGSLALSSLIVVTVRALHKFRNKSNVIKNTSLPDQISARYPVQDNIEPPANQPPVFAPAAQNSSLNAVNPTTIAIADKAINAFIAPFAQQFARPLSAVQPRSTSF